MKKISLLIASILLSLLTFSQTAYLDAVKLKNTIPLDFDKDDTIVTLTPTASQLLVLDSILKKYLPDQDIRSAADDSVLFMKITDAFNTNPFLTIAGVVQNQDNTLAGSKKSLSFSSLISGVAGLDVTKIANGVAMLMIDRAKQELTVAFFRRFQKFVAENKEFQILFPKTTDNLSNLLAYKYPEMLPALRTGFFEDLKSITYRLDDVLELPRYQKLLRNLPEIRIAIRSIRLVHELESGASHPAEIIDKFASLKDWYGPGSSIALNNIGNSLKLAAVFSQSLKNDPARSGDTTRAWITFKDVKTLLSNDTLFTIYLGLIFQDVRKHDIQFVVNDAVIKMDSVIQAQKGNLILFETKISEFIDLATKVDNIKKELDYKQQNHISLTNDDYYSYINTSIDIVEYGFDIAKIFDERFVTEEYIKIARKANDVYKHVYKEEYTQAVSDAMDIYKGIRALVNKRKTELLAKANKGQSEKLGRNFAGNESFDNLSRNELATMNTRLAQDSTQINAIAESDETLSGFSRFIEKVTPYALFMANMIDAKTPEEVQYVLDNAILPVGSSSIKKNSAFNISVQSYLGAFGRIGSLKEEANTSWSDRFGVTAPIGIAFSKGFDKWGSASIFVSLFDIGAIVDYRLKKDSIVNNAGTEEEVTDKKYQIKLGQIISPGAYLVYGFGANLPLSIGFGGQYGPGLSKIDVQGNTVFTNPQWRWNLVLGVDIPFFNITNKNKKYKNK